MAVALSSLLAELGRSAPAEERVCLKILLATAAAGLLREGRVPEEDVSASALDSTMEALKGLQLHRDRIPRNGVVYRGRPDFVTADRLHELQQESRSGRGTAVRFHDHVVYSGAPGARALAFSPEMTRLVRDCAGPVQPTGKANYLYYDEPGMGIDPHVDNEEFSLNVIMMLRHSAISSRRSALVLYPPQAPRERIYLEPGELIVMFADSIVHERERVGLGETVEIVAFGYSPSTA